MSAPYLNDFNGVSYGDIRPGVTPPTFASGLDGPGIRNYNTSSAPRDSLSGAAGLFNFGAPPAVSTVSKKNANYSITRHYRIFPWGDESQELIRKGMLLFIHRARDTDVAAEHVISLGRMNNLIRENCAEYKAMLEYNDPEAKRFEELLKKHGEAGIESFHRAQRKCKTEEQMTTYLGNDWPELKDLYRLATKSILSYVTKFGILNRWNYLGVALSTGMKAESLQTIDMFSATDHLSEVGVVVGGKARVSSVWYNAVAGSKLYLLLRRFAPESLPANFVKTKPYQFIPYCKKAHINIPRRLMEFVDASDNEQFYTTAHVIKVGMVNTARFLGNIRNEEVMTDAIGIGVSTERAYEATANLPDIDVDII